MPRFNCRMSTSGICCVPLPMQLQEVELGAAGEALMQGTLSCTQGMTQGAVIQDPEAGCSKELRTPPELRVVVYCHNPSYLRLRQEDS